MQDVVSHLITADGFWVATLLASANGPTTFIRDFDPTGTPEALVAPTREKSPNEIYEQFRAGSQTFIDTVTTLGDAGLTATAESPIGHVPASMALAHAHWDSWLHERDVFVPLDIAVPVEADELMVSTWYALAVGAVEGGLIDDTSPVGPVLDEPIDVTLRFDDLPDALHLSVDRSVHIARTPAGPDTVQAGSAVELVEAYTGRGDGRDDGRLPDALSTHLTRAFEIL